MKIMLPTAIYRLLNNKNVYLIAIGLLVHIFHGSGQELITINEILALHKIQARGELVYEKTPSMNLFDEISFRTETDEWDIRNQEAIVRFNFNSAKEIRAFKNIRTTRQNYLKSLNKSISRKEVVFHYKQVLNLIYYQKFDKINQKYITVLNDKKSILEKELRNNNTSLSTFLSNNEKLIKAKQFQKLESEKLALIISFLNLNEYGGIDTVGLMDINDIILAVEKLKDRNPQSDKMTTLDYEKQILTSELEYEQAEANKWFEFIQLRYQNDDKLNLGKEISLGASFVLPSQKNNAMQIQDAQLDLLKNDIETMNEYEELEYDFMMAIRAYQESLLQYNSTINLSKELALEDLLSDMKKVPHINPLQLLDIQEGILILELEKIEKTNDVFYSYLDILESLGILQYSSQNFIDKSYLGQLNK